MLQRGMLCIYTVYENNLHVSPSMIRTAKDILHMHAVAWCVYSMDWRGKYILHCLWSDGYIGSQWTYSRLRRRRYLSLIGSIAAKFQVIEHLLK